MPTVIGIVGSLRKGSFNWSLLRSAATLAPSGLTVEVASIRGIPLYDADLERESGIPAPVTELKQRIIASAGLILATPEYNNSIPGVFKNAIDWLTRPPADIPAVFGNRAVGLMGATPGAGGTRMSQTAWLPVLRTLGTRPFFAKQLHVGGAGKVFDDKGELVDDKVREQISAYMKAFGEFIG